MLTHAGLPAWIHHKGHKGAQRTRRKRKERKRKGCGALPHAPAGGSSPCTHGTPYGRACPGRTRHVFPRRRKGQQGFGHFTVRPFGPHYRAHPLLLFHFPSSPACGGTPPICPQSAESAVSLHRPRGRAQASKPPNFQASFCGERFCLHVVGQYGIVISRNRQASRVWTFPLFTRKQGSDHA